MCQFDAFSSKMAHLFFLKIETLRSESVKNFNVFLKFLNKNNFKNTNKVTWNIKRQKIDKIYFVYSRLHQVCYQSYLTKNIYLKKKFLNYIFIFFKYLM